jgi:hypothetical protein
LFVYRSEHIGSALVRSLVADGGRSFAGAEGIHAAAAGGRTSEQMDRVVPQRGITRAESALVHHSRRILTRPGHQWYLSAASPAQIAL